jgi:hypothetical protein
VIECNIPNRKEQIRPLHSVESHMATRLESINLGNALSSPWVGRRPMANSQPSDAEAECRPTSDVHN